MKKWKSFLVLLTCIIVLVACGKTDKGIEEHPEFAGRWQCAESPVEHPEYYTGYLVLVIDEDGSFSMYDAEAGNPGISGMIQNVTDNELELVCDMDEDFDPPVTWENMSETQMVTYEFGTDKEVQLTFASEEGASTLAFTKVE